MVSAKISLKCYGLGVQIVGNGMVCRIIHLKWQFHIAAFVVV
jgi:hypothetical protein